MKLIANDFCVIAITETWLNKDQEVKEHIPEGFSVYRADREDGRIGGGTMLLVQQHLTQTEGKSLVLPNIQIVSCNIKARRKSLLVICVYRSPMATEEENEQLLGFLVEEYRVVIKYYWSGISMPRRSTGKRNVHLMAFSGTAF
jgi:hypothetical protein